MDREMLWVEKYRPKTLEDMKLPETALALFQKNIEEAFLPNYLFSGSVGTGKTTVARILLDQIDCVVLALNASDDRGIETIRNRVKPFLMSATPRKWKVVFFDEADMLTSEAQTSLRNIMEEHADHGRFILTANYERKIIEPIQSRCHTVSFQGVTQEDVVRLLQEICEAESIKADAVSLMDLTEEHYPDIRKAITTLQLLTKDREFVYERASSFQHELLAAIQAKDFVRIVTLLENNPLTEFTEMYEFLFDAAKDLKVGDKGKVRLLVAEYLYRDATVAIKRINFLALCERLIREK